MAAHGVAHNNMDKLDNLSTASMSNPKEYAAIACNWLLRSQ